MLIQRGPASTQSDWDEKGWCDVASISEEKLRQAWNRYGSFKITFSLDKKEELKKRSSMAELTLWADDFIAMQKGVFNLVERLIAERDSLEDECGRLKDMKDEIAELLEDECSSATDAEKLVDIKKIVDKK